jgi:adenosylcobinamide-GDP ribazoletransferase
LQRLLAELTHAFGLLTRLPVGRFVWATPVKPAAYLWAYPIVGGAVGAIGGAVYWLSRSVGMPSALGAIWTLAAMIAVTGAFHEDGLADTADGFGGGATHEKKLEIMRDSRIGTFGVLALALSLAIRAAAVVAIADRARVASALVVAACLGRGAMVGILMMLSPARRNGLGVSVARPTTARAAAALAVSTATAFLLLPASIASFALLLAGAACVAMTLLARAQIGGYTGDVLGAGEQLTECVVLSLLAQQFRAI